VEWSIYVSFVSSLAYDYAQYYYIFIYYYYILSYIIIYYFCFPSGFVEFAPCLTRILCWSSGANLVRTPFLSSRLTFLKFGPKTHHRKVVYNSHEAMVAPSFLTYTILVKPHWLLCLFYRIRSLAQLERRVVQALWPHLVTPDQRVKSVIPTR